MKNLSFISGWNLKSVGARSRAITYILVMMFANTQIVNAQQDETPNLEFLEFLGEGIKIEDEIIDPMGYQEIEKMTGSDQEQQVNQQDDEK